MTKRNWADSTPIVPFGGYDGIGNDKTQFQRIVELERDLAAREEELARVKAERDAARKDAERYRWLREHCDSMSLDPPLTVAKVGGWGLEAWSGDDLDATIDAAIAGEPK